MVLPPDLLYWLYAGSQGSIFFSILFLTIGFNRSKRLVPSESFPFHMSRFVCQLVVVIISLYQIAEVSLTDINNVTFSFHEYICTVFQILNALCLTFFVNCIEQHKKFKFYICVCLSSINGLAFSCVILAEDLLSHRSEHHHIWKAREVIRLTVASTFFVLLSIDCATALITRCFRKLRENIQTRDLSNFALKHQAVHAVSRLSFGWMNDTVALGSKRPLESSDIKNLPEDLLSAYEANSIKQCRSKNQERSLLGALFLVHWWDLLCVAAGFTIVSLAMVTAPATIAAIITFANRKQTMQFESTQPNVSEFFGNGFVLSFTLLCLLTLTLVCDNACLFQLAILGCKLQAGLQALIFEKAMRLKSEVFSNEQTSAGRIVNLTVADTFNIVKGTITLSLVVKFVLKATAGTTIMYVLIGNAGLVILAFFVVVPLCLGLQKLQGSIRTENLAHADDRLKFTGELMSGMKYFKVQGWDARFSKKVEKARQIELGSWIRHQITSRVIQFILMSCSGILMFMMILTNAYISDHTMTVPQLIFGLGVVQTISMEIRLIAVEGAFLVSSIVSVFRIGAFLRLPETSISQGDVISDGFVAEMWGEIIGNCNGDKETKTSCNVEDSSECATPVGKSEKSHFPASPTERKSYSTLQKLEPEVNSKSVVSSNLLIDLEDAKFAWNTSDETGTICVPLLHIQRTGQLISIVGSCGSGKSTLLAGILGELSLMKGSAAVQRNGGFAYSSQNPWILNATFRHNIILDAEFDQQWYEMVVEACTLDHDRALMCDGDHTEIGEKGANLSGGQKARLSLARAIYCRNQLVLLDDPLSALDTKVANRVFHNAILELLVKRGKTVLLVTHLLQFAALSNHTLVIDKGEVVEQGAWRSLRSDRSVELKAAAAQLQTNKDEDDEQAETKGTLEKQDESKSDFKWKTSQDERLRGTVYLKSFSELFGALPRALPFTVTLGFLAVACFTAAADFYLSEWTHALSERPTPNATRATLGERGHKYYGFYSTFLVCMIASLCFLLGNLGIIGYLASRNLHNKMLRSVVCAPMSFFDTNRLGKIINRFSNDIFFLDFQISPPIEEIISCSLVILSAFVLQLISTPLTGVALVLFLLATAYMLRYSDPVTRELMRLRNIFLSPILGHVTESINGLIVIRSLNQTKNQLVAYLKLVDKNNATFMTLNVAFRWVALRLDIFATCLVFLLAIFGLITVSYEVSDVQVFGLALVYCVQANGLLRQTAYHVLVGTSQLNALDRILAFCEILPEKGRESGLSFEDVHDSKKGGKPAGNTKQFSYQRLDGASEDLREPERTALASEITYQDVYLKYHPELPPAVKNVTLTVNRGTRLGICGRTGSGKTTLIHSLFRVVPIDQGRIMKDGVDITTLPLTELRRQMTMIPQDPVLLRGDVRYNLDPFSEFEDEMIWKAVNICQLSDKVTDLGDAIAEEGENLSAGQRQLFCLARAFLRQTSILVLDEVTSCVDLETDEAIQKILKEHFLSTTIIAIAHRVRTLLDYDMVVVMRDGCIVEEGPPDELMTKENGEYRSLVEAGRFRHIDT